MMFSIAVILFLSLQFMRVLVEKISFWFWLLLMMAGKRAPPNDKQHLWASLEVVQWVIRSQRNAQRRWKKTAEITKAHWPIRVITGIPFCRDWRPLEAIKDTSALFTRLNSGFKRQNRQKWSHLNNIVQLRIITAAASTYFQCNKSTKTSNSMTMRQEETSKWLPAIDLVL